MLSWWSRGPGPRSRSGRDGVVMVVVVALVVVIYMVVVVLFHSWHIQLKAAAIQPALQRMPEIDGLVSLVCSLRFWCFNFLMTGVSCDPVEMSQSHET